ncbi:MAG: threonine/serine dehydratase [Jatrophihabitans sp.]
METELVGAAGLEITREDIRDTYRTIGPYLRRTPVLELAPRELLGERADDFHLVLKLEQLQCAGSFKARGAFANLLSRRVPSCGVVAASGGNHGVAVAYAADRLGVPATIFVPKISAQAKVDAIRASGADFRFAGDRYADALAAAEEWAAECGALQVHAFDQRETILGQGSLALELDEQVPELDTVLVPVGGGGLIAGIAAYFAGSVRVVGVEPAESPTLTRARLHGTPADAPVGGIAADALAPRRVGELVFPITQAHVAEVVLVDDDEIPLAQQALWRAARLIAEPAAAVGIAALRAGAYRPEPGERVAVVISGANTQPRDVGDGTGGQT